MRSEVTSLTYDIRPFIDYTSTRIMEKKIITPEKALQKAEKYCAYQERSQQEVRDKIYSWGLHRNDVENIISTLITGGFLKEERFAFAYANGKFRIKKWGKNKIREALRGKKVSETLINKSLSEIDNREYTKTLKEVVRLRLKNTLEKDERKKLYKTATYVISRGFESELVWETLKELAD